MAEANWHGGLNSYKNLFIRLVTPEYFLATKIEAFEGRGKDDYLLSHDLEDIVTLLDGRREVVDEISAAEIDVQKYLKIKMYDFLNDSRFLEALYGHLPADESEQRYPLVLERIKLIAA